MKWKFEEAEKLEFTIDLLKELITIPSFSGEEKEVADLVEHVLEVNSCKVFRKGNNVWAKKVNKGPVLLLNSHLDTVKPNDGYTRDPFLPEVLEGKLFGLGSNDAGGSLVCMLATFLSFHEDQHAYSLLFAATAEEENSGANGISSILSELNFDMAIVGEPTCMEAAVTERGLVVLDCESRGKAGHAARNEGVNAIELAMKDLQWFMSHSFQKESEWLGKVSMNVTQINAGTQHNVVPDRCQFVVDVRLNELYSFEELIEEINSSVSCKVKARSFRLGPSRIDMDHPLIKAAVAVGAKPYGSPTTSDQTLISVPSLKMGAGDSARSHMADEYIFISDLQLGLKRYAETLEMLNKEILKNSLPYEIVAEGK